MTLYVVACKDTADALGSGDVPVLATPRLIAWLEAATVGALTDLGDDDTSVGTRVDVQHLLASPLGASVEATAALVHRDGRLCRFAVAAHHDVGDGPVLIAHGEITRVIVGREKFIERSTPDIIIRPVVPQEWPAVGELCVVAYSVGSGLSSDTGTYVHTLRDVATRSGECDVLVAYAEGGLVGSVTIVHPGSSFADVARDGEVEFRFMAVDPLAWGRGIGLALVQEVMARAGTSPVVCSVIEGNEPAARLYVRAGLVPVPTRDHSPAPGVRLRAFSTAP